MHNCDLHGDDTVQSMLLLGNVVREKMEEICQHCLYIYKHDVNNSPEYVVFSSKVFEIERLPLFAQENLEQAVLEWSRIHPHVIPSIFYSIDDIQQDDPYQSIQRMLLFI